MTHNNSLVFTVFLFNLLTKTLEIDNIDNVSQELFACLHDCTQLQYNGMYSVNSVVEIKNPPEILYMAPDTSTPYQKNYRTDLTATICSVKVQVFPYLCGTFSHTSYVHDQNSITCDVIVTSERCRLASRPKKRSKIGLLLILHVSSTIECTMGQIKHYVSETSMERVGLTYKYRIKYFSSRDRNRFPCH